MKTFKLAQGFLLATFFSAVSAEASYQWLARETRNQSCMEQGYAALPAAVQDAKEVGLTVASAKVGYLKKRMMCMACGCPEGSLYLVQVEDQHGLDNLIVGKDFKKVEEKDLVFRD